jgi:hypothetical protein
VKEHLDEGPERSRRNEEQDTSPKSVGIIESV